MPEKKAYHLEQRLPTDLFDPILEKPLLDHAYQLGYDAFVAHQHYRANPFNPQDWQRSDVWDEGWSAAESANPGKFDHSTDRFIFTRPYIDGNPSCPF